VSITPGLISQTEARLLARLLSGSTQLPHVAHTVPLGCWGGTERGWAVSGPAVPVTELQLQQALMRAQLITDARAKLRQAERAQDWVAMLDATLEIERIDQL